MALLKLEDDGDWISLSDRRQPDLQFQVSSAILELDLFVRAVPIRRQLEKVLGRREWMRRIKVSLLFLLGFLVLAWGSSFLMAWGVRSVVRGISAQREIEFGDKAFRKIERHLVLLNNTNVLPQLAALSAPLLAAVPVKGIPFQFYLSAGPPNAFALPGGRIIVTSGLLELMDTPEQLLAVVAHESAHVAQRHAFQQIIAGQGPIFLMEILSGGQDKMLNVLAFPSELLAYESFSQKYEREADALGWEYLVKARINPHGMIEALKKLRATEAAAGESQRGSAYASHPDLDRRLQWLEAKWQALPHPNGFLTLTNPVPKVAGDRRLEPLLIRLRT